MIKKTYNLIFTNNKDIITAEGISIDKLNEEYVNFVLFKDVNIYIINIIGKKDMTQVSVITRNKDMYLPEKSLKILPIENNKSFMSITGLASGESERKYDITIIYN